MKALRLIGGETIERWIEPSPPAGHGGSPSAGQFLLCILALTAVLTAWQFLIAWNSPLFDGDEGIRLLGANSPVVKLGNRVWLPVLQSHIWLLYLLRAPYVAFRMIPVLYYFLSLFLLGLLGWKLLGRSLSSLLFLVFLVACFGGQRVILSSGHRLYQEIIGIPLLFLLLLSGILEFRRCWWTFPVAAVAMMTRDSFWIYLFVFTLCNVRVVLRDRKIRRLVLAVWAVPALWILMIPILFRVVYHRFPAFPLEWPLMINKDSGRVVTGFGEGGVSLLTAFVHAKADVLLLALVAGGLLLALGVRAYRPSGNLNQFAAKFAPFSLLSLAVTYGLILVFDPWEATAGNPRMALPFLEHAFVWAILLFGWAQRLSLFRRTVVTVAICSGLLLSWETKRDLLEVPDNEKLVATYSALRQAIDDAGGFAGKKSCFVFRKRIWDDLGNLAAPTFYSRHDFLKRNEMPYPADCDYLYLRSPVSEDLGDRYRLLGEFEIRDAQYAVYVRK